MGKMASPTLWATLPEALLRLQAQLCVVLSIILAESWVGNRGLRGGLWDLSLPPPGDEEDRQGPWETRAAWPLS